MSNQVYQEIDLTSRVLGASPKQLIEMLLEKCLIKINEAKNFMQAANIVEKCKSITRALDILIYLQSCLRADTAETKKVAEIFSTVYNDAQQLLIQANATNDTQFLIRAHSIISELKSGWSEAKGY